MYFAVNKDEQKLPNSWLLCFVVSGEKQPARACCDISVVEGGLAVSGGSVLAWSAVFRPLVLGCVWSRLQALAELRFS